MRSLAPLLTVTGPFLSACGGLKQDNDTEEVQEASASADGWFTKEIP